MRPQQVGLTVAGAFVVLSMVLAAGTIWLSLTDPVTVANAVNEGEVSPFLEDLARVIFEALRNILRYL